MWNDDRSGNDTAVFNRRTVSCPDLGLLYEIVPPLMCCDQGCEREQMAPETSDLSISIMLRLPINARQEVIYPMLGLHWTI